MAALVFDESTMLNGNMFQFEDRLQSHVNKFVESGAMLTTWYHINDEKTTTNRGTQTVDQLIGPKSPLRFNKIKDFPIYEFNRVDVGNKSDDQGEDIEASGEFIILPSTEIPSPNDFFTINHLKMTSLFRVMDVQVDSMRPNGYYKCRYKLYTTDPSVISLLEKQTINTYQVNMNAIGSTKNPIVKEDDFKKQIQVEKMVAKMIQSYKSMFYDSRHNCFLYDLKDGRKLFDMTGHMFMSKFDLMNTSGSCQVLNLTQKITDPMYELYYNNSIHSWLEIGASRSLLSKFQYELVDSGYYPNSSFARLYDDVVIIKPLAVGEAMTHMEIGSFFNSIQFDTLSSNESPSTSYAKLIHKYIHDVHGLTISDVSSDTAQMLLTSSNTIEVFLYTPIVIYIIRQILKLN